MKGADVYDGEALKTIITTTSSFGSVDPAPLRRLEASGYRVILNPHGRKLTEEELLELIEAHDPVGMIAGTGPVSDAVMGRAPSLAAVSRCGIGMDNVDVAAAQRRGIRVVNTPDAPSRAVAELTVGLFLAVLRGIVLADRHIRAGKWTRPMGRLLGACTVGIVGCGRIGTAVARCLEPMAGRLIGFDPGLSEHDVIELITLDDLLEASDVVTLHVPALPETVGMVDRDFLDAMKEGAFLINAARGEIVQEDDLRDALRSGGLGGAALDVFGREPYEGPLAREENVVLTSHIGSYASEARVQMEDEAAEKLLGLLA